MNFRQLIEQAMHEAQEEFAQVVTAKLAALLGTEQDRGQERRPRGRPRSEYSDTPARVRAKAGAALRTRGPARGSGRATPQRMEFLTELVQKALTDAPRGEWLSSGQILKLAKIDPEESKRLRNVLLKLRNDGLVAMRGTRAAARYQVKS